MSSLALIGLGILIVIGVGWSLYEFFGDAQRFIAPDNADRDAINAEHGVGTPEARTELERRFGPGGHWKDAKTGIAGLSGILLLLWIWLG
jgi:hypothetical protein